jgi:glycosyltransferase involved in cell wall biosynthesis
MIYCAVQTMPIQATVLRKSAREAVLFVGSINEWKGLKEIVAGLRCLRHRAGSSPALHIAGEIVDSVYWAEVKVAAEGAGVELNYLGLRRDITDIMPGYEVLIHGTKRKEPFGLVVAEAVLAGCFVVSSGLGGVREILPEPMITSCFDPNVPSSLARVLSEIDGRVASYRAVRDRTINETLERFGVSRYKKQIREFGAQFVKP